MSALPKALLVAVSVAFCAGAAVITVPKPASFASRARAPEAIDCRREPDKCAHTGGYALGVEATNGAITCQSAALTPAPSAAATQPRTTALSPGVD